jgi:Putative zinc-finger
MSNPFVHPLSFETLVAYWAGDLSPEETDAVDAHAMGCATCTTASERVAAITEAIRTALPPVISTRELASLRARGLRVEENRIFPGQRVPVVFRGDLDLLIHRLGGLDLSRAERVHVTASAEETGQILSETPRAPFDAASGEVLIACQRHFAALPPNIVFDVAVIEAGGARASTRYAVPHSFEPV